MILSSPYVRLGAAIALSAGIGFFSLQRFQHAGAWLPSIPSRLEAWEGTETPIPRAILEGLGSPQSLNREYVTPFGEQVIVSVISAGQFENYHDPTVCVPGQGFVLTAKRNLVIDGPGSPVVRAMIFKRTDNSDVRMVMYYWQQNRDGSWANDAVMGNYRDVGARLKTGFGAVALGRQALIVRIYSAYGPEDAKGLQTQRNVHEVSRAVYRSMMKEKA